MRITFILLILVLISCRETKVRDKNIIYIDQEDLREIQNFNPQQLIDSITYIPLETSQNILLGEIRKLQMTDQRIYLINAANDSLYVFDRNGKFLNNIGKKGRGPGEHIFLDTYVIFNDTIITYDSYLNRITFYTTDNKYLKSIDVSRHLHRDSNLYRTVHDLCLIAPDHLLFDHGLMHKSNVSHSIYNFTKDTLIDIGFFPFQLKFPSPYGYVSFIPKSFACQDSQIYCITPFNDTIFQYQNQKLVPHFVVNAMKESLIPIEKATRQNGKDITDAVHILFNKGAFLSNIATQQNYFFFIYADGDEKKEIIWNTYTQQGIKFTYDFSDDDYIYAPSILSCSFLFSEEYPSSIHHNPQMEALKKRLTEEDNPVIAIYHLKSDF